MRKGCPIVTSGGKGNVGKFYEREPRICAAGLPSKEPERTMAEAFDHYILQDKVDALIGDAILPEPKPRPLPPLRHPPPIDKRHGCIFTEISSLISPPTPTKFETLVQDIKETTYSSYWNKQTGKGADSTPLLPIGMDPINTTFGAKSTDNGRLYEIIMPRVQIPEQVPKSKEVCAQTDRRYCQPPFSRYHTFGYRSMSNGRFVKCALTDDKVITGTATATVVTGTQAKQMLAKRPQLGIGLSPNNNINEVPVGHSFGILKPPENMMECLSMCEYNPRRNDFLRCLKHLNTLRKSLRTRYLPPFYRKFLFQLKYVDKEKSGWLPKKVLYDMCASKLIRFDPDLLEPLLCLWNAIDGDNKIDYDFFLQMLNCKSILPDLPKIEDFDPTCLGWSTTYKDQVKPGKPVDKRFRAGLPSGRYFDKDYPIRTKGCLRADRINLMDETDCRVTLNPCVFTLLTITHRDMYAKREQPVVRRVFEASGEQFTDEKFNAIWEEAKTYHTQGFVCYETFRRALRKLYPETQP